MDIVITLNENDLMKNPNIIDLVKGFARSLKEDPKAEEIGFTHTPVEPVDAVEEGNPADCLAEEREREAEEQAPWEEPAAEQPTEPVADAGAEIAVSIEELRAALAKVSKKHGAATARQLLQKHGAESISALEAKFYAAVLEEAKAVL